MTRLSFALSCALLMWGCDGTTRSFVPTAPSPPITPPAAPGPPAAPQTYTLSGMVFEKTSTGQEPVEGVEVYCDSCGSPVGHTFAYTDAQGSYSFSWAHNGAHPLLVRKDGYDVVAPTLTFSNGMGQRIATVNGDTLFDIEIIRR